MKEFQSAFESGIESLRLGNFHNAVAQLAPIYQYHPTWAAWYSLALSSVGDFQQARVVAAFASARGFRPAMALMAIANRVAGHPSDVAMLALDNYRSFEHPWDAITAREMGYVHSQQRDLQAACDCFDVAWRVLKQNQTNWLLSGLGVMYTEALRHRGDYIHAIDVAQQALGYAPAFRQPALHYHRALALIELGACAEAQKDVAALGAVQTREANDYHQYLTGRIAQWQNPELALQVFSALLTQTTDPEMRFYAEGRIALALAFLGQPYTFPRLIAHPRADICMANLFLWNAIVQIKNGEDARVKLYGASGIFHNLGMTGHETLCRDLITKTGYALPILHAIDPEAFPQNTATLPHLIITPHSIRLNGVSVRLPRTRAYVMLHALAEQPLGLTTQQLKDVVAKDAESDSARAQVRNCRIAIEKALHGLKISIDSHGRNTLSSKQYLLTIGS